MSKIVYDVTASKMSLYKRFMYFYSSAKAVYEGYDFEVLSQLATRADAVAMCAARGGYLPSILSDAETNFIGSLVCAR